MTSEEGAGCEEAADGVSGRGCGRTHARGAAGLQGLAEDGMRRGPGRERRAAGSAPGCSVPARRPGARRRSQRGGRSLPGDRDDVREGLREV